LKCNRFEPIKEQNACLTHWETRWAALRIRGSERHQLHAMFEGERAHVRPLPSLPMVYFRDEHARVCNDGCMRVAHCSYATRLATIAPRRCAHP
jgi:hypothetical protein